MKRHAIALLLGCATLLPAAATDSAAGAPGTALPEAQLQKLLTAYALIKREYVGQADDDKLFDGALSGMLAALDPHSAYLNRDGMREIGRETSGDYVGIGISVALDGERMRIVNVTAGSPAAAAGIRPGEIVTAIDGVEMGGLAGAEVGRRMHGAPGTRITLLLAPGAGHATERTVTVTRAALRDSTVTVGSAAPGLARIRIEEFGGTTGAELAAALKKLDAQGAPRGLIVDLRNNPGGMLPAAVAVAGAFLPPGTTVFSARGREPEKVQTVTIDPRYYRHADEDDVLAALPAWSRTVPLVVLVNGASASAAELLAGALQDHGRAKIVGARTFGKGSIQSVIPLDAASGVKFTVARYVTPNGHEVQAHGIVPDVPAAPAAAGLNAGLLPREADLANHLPSVEETAAPAPAAAARVPAEPTDAFGTRADRALQAAVALLAPERERQPALVALAARLRRLVR